MQHGAMRAGAWATVAVLTGAVAASSEGFASAGGGEATIAVWRHDVATGDYEAALATLPAGTPALLLACATEPAGESLRRIALWPNPEGAAGDAERLRRAGARTDRATVSRGAAISGAALTVEAGQAVAWIEGEAGAGAAIAAVERHDGPALAVVFRLAGGSSVAVAAYAAGVEAEPRDGERCIVMDAR